MGCFSIYSKFQENSDLLIVQNEKLIQQNQQVLNTISTELMQSMNLLGEKISNLQNSIKSKESNPFIKQITNDEKINIVFIYNGERINVPIDRDKTLKEAFQVFQERQPSCKDINKLRVIYNTENIVDKIKQGDLISSLGISSNIEMKVDFIK